MHSLTSSTLLPSRHHLLTRQSPHLFQSCDLLANEEVEGHFRHEEAGSGAIGVVDGCSDILVGKSLERINGGQAVRKNLVENVTAAAAAHQQGEARPGGVGKQYKQLDNTRPEKLKLPM